MGYDMEKTCALCHAAFSGQASARYCCDKHRWVDNRRKAYAMGRKKALDPAIQAELPTEEPKPRKTAGSYAKDKGARVEREVCEIITRATGEKTNRLLGQARDGGADVAWGPFAIEVKARETVAMPAWQSQVMAAVEGTDNIPAVVWRRKAEKFWIALPFDAFLEVFETLRKAAQQAVDDGR